MVTKKNNFGINFDGNNMIISNFNNVSANNVFAAVLYAKLKKWATGGRSLAGCKMRPNPPSIPTDSGYHIILAYSSQGKFKLQVTTVE